MFFFFSYCFLLLFFLPKTSQTLPHPKPPKTPGKLPKTSPKALKSGPKSGGKTALRSTPFSSTFSHVLPSQKSRFRMGGVVKITMFALLPSVLFSDHFSIGFLEPGSACALTFFKAFCHFPFWHRFWTDFTSISGARDLPKCSQIRGLGAPLLPGPF